MIRRPPRSTQSRSSAASDVYKRQNRIFALRNGTIGWTLAGHDVVRGRTERVLQRPQATYPAALSDAKAWARRVGVPVLDRATYDRFVGETHARTLHLLDVRTPEEYTAAHPPGF